MATFAKEIRYVCDAERIPETAALWTPRSGGGPREAPGGPNWSLLQKKSATFATQSGSPKVSHPISTPFRFYHIVCTTYIAPT